MAAPLLDLRHRYVHPAPPAVELRAFTHGLMPRTVPAMLAAFAGDWAARGVDAWNAVPDHWGTGAPTGWWGLPEHLGDHFIAPLLGAPAGTCIHQPNVHWTVQALLSADAPFAGGRDEIVLTEAEFPSVRHSARQWAALRGLRVTELPPGPDGFLDAGALHDAISERTAWVFVSHVGFTTGEKVPGDVLRALAARARDAGAHFALDGYHATATGPIDAPALGADVYFGGLLKEGSGSSGNAYLYVRPGLDLVPRLSGWFADAEPFGFHGAPRPHPDVRRRFLAGTTAIASLYHAVEGVRILLEAGLEAVRADSLAKTARAIARAEAAGLALRSPREAARRSAMVILEVPHADRLSAYLKTEHVFTDSRQGRFLRLAPFVWNTADDVDRAFDVVAHALRTDAHLREQLPAEGGPVT
ncbi:MAG: aminotransferase class V-fold PLP-dependent enzyme [Rubricoccaceae bacterium]